MHEQMKENKEKYAAVADPEQTTSSLEVGLSKSRSFLSPFPTLVCLVNNFNFNFNFNFNCGRMTSFRRHGPIPAIDGLGCPADAQEPGVAAAARARADRAGDALGAASRAGDRVPSRRTGRGGVGT